MSEHIKIDGIWDRIDEVIAEKNISKSEIARRCGFERRTLAGRSDNRMLSLGALARFCSTMHVSADYILGISRNKEL